MTCGTWRPEPLSGLSAERRSIEPQTAHWRIFWEAAWLSEWMDTYVTLLPQYYVRWIPRGLEISPELLLCYSSKLPCILDTLLQWYPIVFLGGRRARRRLWRFGCSSPDAMCGLGPWIQFYCALFDFMFSKPGPHDLPNIVSWPRRSADQWKQPSILSSGSQGCHFCTSGPPSDWRFLPRISRFGARFQCLSYGCQESATECQAGFQDKMHLMHYSRPGTTQVSSYSNSGWLYNHHLHVIIVQNLVFCTGKCCLSHLPSMATSLFLSSNSKRQDGTHLILSIYQPLLVLLTASPSFTSTDP